MPPIPGRTPLRILVLDVGGSHVRARLSYDRHQFRIISGPKMTPRKMVRQLDAFLKGFAYDGVTIGYPGVVRHGRILQEPHNLGGGWVGFDFRKGFGCPVRILNDAAMQALGSYRTGHLLFLGLGTGLGSAFVIDGIVQPMELAHMPYQKGRTYEDYLGEAGLERLGTKKWRKEVHRVVGILAAGLQPDEVVLGGGNVRKLRDLPPLCRRGNNRNAITGGFRIWREGSAWTELARARGQPRRART